MAAAGDEAETSTSSACFIITLLYLFRFIYICIYILYMYYLLYFIYQFNLKYLFDGYWFIYAHMLST